MSRKKILVQALVVVAGVILLSSSTSWAILCQANADCNTKVDLSDLVIMKQDFNKTGCDSCMCNPNSDCPTGMIECSGVCVDPMTDEAYCGSCSNSCASEEVCFAGSCYTGGVVIQYQAPPKTGQTICYDSNGTIISCDGTGQDGDLQKGAPWPTPRFTDNNNGTVTDNLTGLIWLKNANCYGTRTWSQALVDCNGLHSGQCELTDGSVEGDWRLPNLFDLESLRDMAYYDPALSNTAGTGQWTEGDPFNNVQSDYYWSSTTYANMPYGAWGMTMDVGVASYYYKDGYGTYFWPVRGGQ